MYLPFNTSAMLGIALTAANRVPNKGHFVRTNKASPGGGNKTSATSWMTPLEASWSVTKIRLPDAVTTCNL